MHLRWITPALLAFTTAVGLGAVPAEAATAVTYTCKSPLGTDMPAQFQVRSTLPATAPLGQNLDLEWTAETPGLLAQDAIPPGAVVQKGTLKISTTPPGPSTPPATGAPTTTSSTPTPTGSATPTADPIAVLTTSAPNGSGIGKGQPLLGGAMKGTYTPRSPGTLSVAPGDITVIITRDGTTQETVCTPEVASPILGSITITDPAGTPSTTPTSSPSPTLTPTTTPTPTVTVTAQSTDTDPAHAMITPVGSAPTGGGGLAGPDPLPYLAGGAVVLLLALGIGWERRRRRVHGL
ncbi:hypothetical protein AB0J71_46395 [Nonomuraea sp. NPDC049637]|uniref:hypothetical protein n=1 Tax=Nonomuraea sp. NPDC049637 TaxID=3154356 RepID=UPI00344073A6